MKEVCRFNYKNETFVLYESRYLIDPDIPAYMIYDLEGIPFCTLSVNLMSGRLDDDERLRPGEFWVKIWNENAQISKAVLNLDIFENTNRTAKAGFQSAEIWRKK